MSLQPQSWHYAQCPLNIFIDRMLNTFSINTLFEMTITMFCFVVVVVVYSVGVSMVVRKVLHVEG